MSSLWPQFEQVLLDGKKRLILTKTLPYQLHLYSNIVTKVDQEASEIDLDNLRFFSIPETLTCFTNCKNFLFRGKVYEHLPN